MNEGAARTRAGQSIPGTLIGTGAVVVLGALLAAMGTLASAGAAPLTQDGDGQRIYEERCAGCHGVAGDGQGPAADNLFTKPRDFTRDEYKIKSTAGDEFPSRQDLIAVIADGMPGSSMPGWRGVLSEGEMGALADYIQSFGRFFPDDGYGTTAIEVPGRVRASAESIERGRELFASEIECIKCHGAEGRGDGPSAFEQTDNAGHVIYPADLTQPWLFRGGGEPEQIYLRLRTGLPGSPMPAFADALSEEETWHLVNYILSLAPEPAPEPAVLLVSHYVDGPLPDDPNDGAWSELEAAYYPLTPQLMRTPRHYWTAINAVWVRSLYNDAEVAFHVAWNDRSETRDGETVDALAIQFPQELDEDNRRPYFVFGDALRPVYQWHWTAAGGVSERNAQGLEAVGDQAADEQQVTATAVHENGRWQLVLRRPLDSAEETDLQFETDRFIPVSFMAWEGQTGEAGPRLGLTPWSQLYLESPRPPARYAWVPGAAILVVVVEGLALWRVRRSARREEEE